MQIWGHRGAYCYAPENTLPSFQKAIELGADGVEFDVQLTKDGEVVVIHDERLERTSDGIGFVKDYTYADIQKYNFNKNSIGDFSFVSIPSLQEALVLLKPTSLAINIELKTGVVYYDGLEQKTVDLVEKYGLSDRVIYSSFNHYSLQKVKEYAPNARIALLCGGGVLVTGEQCEKIGAYALHPSIQQLRFPGLVADCHKRGIKVNAWTVDSDVDYAYAKGCGVDGIFVNDLIKYNENAEPPLSARETTVYKRLEDDLSRKVFYARKKCAQFGVNHFQSVFEQPELFNEIREMVCNHPYVIYGAGIITRRASVTLQSWDAWRNCAAIYDRNEQLQGQQINGVEILPPPQCTLPVSYVLNGVYKGNASSYRSANQYLQAVHAAQVYDACDIVDNLPLQYFDYDIICSRLTEKEVFVDGGCFDFGTSMRLMELAPGVNKIYAFKPAQEQLQFVKENISKSGFNNICLEKAAHWSLNTELNFSFADCGGSHISEDGTKVKGVALDSIIPVDEQITFIKLDVGGGELEALKGAKRLISQQYPKLAISIYHKPDDYVDIMEYLMEIAPNYKFYMRQYSTIDVETVLYAVV